MIELIIRDKFTGEEIDTGDSNPRLNRLTRRVKAFGDALDVVREDHNFILKMITLTYAPNNDWKKNQIKEFMRDLRKVTGKDMLAYGWVAELQKRGAVHYHLYIAVEPHVFVPKLDDSGMWPYGMSRVETGKSPYYLLSYASKRYQKIGKFPRGLRMFHVWIRKGLLSKRNEWVFRLSAYPIWLVEQIMQKGDFYLGQIPTRRTGGGWKIKHPNSVKNHVIWVPFFTPYEIVRWTSRGSGFPSLFSLDPQEGK